MSDVRRGASPSASAEEMDLLLQSNEVSFGDVEEEEEEEAGAKQSDLLGSSSNRAEDDDDDEDGGDDGSEILAAGGGFVVRGKVSEFLPVRTVDLCSEDPTVDVSSDDDDVDGTDGAVLGDEEVQVVTIRPLSKSRLISPPPREESALQVVGEEERSEINIQERTGSIKEYIDDGLGVVFSMECGLVLFHLRNLHFDGDWLGENYVDWVDRFPPGTQVTFLDSYHEGEEFKCVSQEGFIRQVR